MHRKVILLQCIVATVMARRYRSRAEYNCRFGPDSKGEYVEDVVESGIALHCGSFCSCTGLVNNQCYFGPYEESVYLLEQVKSEIVDTCDRSTCFCDTHVYEFNDVTFAIIDARQEIEELEERSVIREEVSAI